MLVSFVVSLFSVNARSLTDKENESNHAKMVDSGRSLRSISGEAIDYFSVFVQVQDFNKFGENLFHNFKPLRDAYENDCPTKNSITSIRDDTRIPSALKSVTCKNCHPFCIPVQVTVPLLEKRSNCLRAKGSCYRLIFRNFTMAYYYKKPY